MQQTITKPNLTKIHVAMHMASLGRNELMFQWLFGFTYILTHWEGRNKMDAISQTTFSSAFSWLKFWIPIKISLKFVLKGSINNIPALVQIMAWRRPGDKPLSWPMMVSLLTHICVTRPQWVNIVEACWHTCALVNWDIIESGKGLSPRQSMALANADLFFEEFEFENVVFKMSTTLFMPQCVKYQRDNKCVRRQVGALPEVY